MYNTYQSEVPEVYLRGYRVSTIIVPEAFVLLQLVIPHTGYNVISCSLEVE